VVDVRVRENHGVQLGDRYRKGAVLIGGLLPLALKHSAIEGNGVSVDVQQVTRPGDFPGGADEGDLQPLAFCYRIALEQDDQPLLVL
jgi:hypothetical protein